MTDDVDLIRAATVDTLRTVAEWGPMSREELLAVAESVDTMVVSEGLCCPVCEEVDCDDGCPLAPVRSSSGTPGRGRIFESPADLVGNIATGDLLSDASGMLIQVRDAVCPEDFPESDRGIVAGQHCLVVFGVGPDFVPGWDSIPDVRWPLRAVRVVDVDD